MEAEATLMVVAGMVGVILSLKCEPRRAIHLKTAEPTTILNSTASQGAIHSAVLKYHGFRYAGDATHKDGFGCRVKSNSVQAVRIQ